MTRALRRHDRRRRPGRRQRGDPAGACRLVGRAGREAALPAPQGLRRVHRREQPALLDALGVGAEVDRLAGAELRRVALLRGAASVVAALPRRRRRAAASAGRSGASGSTGCSCAQAGAAASRCCSRARCRRSRAARAALRVCLRPGEGGAENESSAALVVAAHGSWEPLPWGARNAASSAGRATCSLSRPTSGAAIDAGLLPVLAFAGGYGGMVVADDGIATLACCIRAGPARPRSAQRARASAPAKCSRPSCGASAPASPTRCGRRARRRVARDRADPSRRAARAGRRRLSHRQCRGRGASDHRRRHQHGDPVGVRARRRARSGTSVAGRRATLMAQAARLREYEAAGGSASAAAADAAAFAHLAMHPAASPSPGRWCAPGLASSRMARAGAASPASCPRRRARRPGGSAGPPRVALGG